MFNEIKTFPRSARLTKTGEFSSVFSFRKCYKGKFLSLYYFLQNFHEKSPKIFESARLGIVIAKKMLKKSVDRNRCKRILREIFRQNRFDIGNFDIILRLNYKNITSLTNYNKLLQEDCLNLFNRLKKLKN